jgi:excisionase family DNA binding protein
MQEPHLTYMSAKDVASVLGVCELSVRRWIKHGQLRAGKFGRRWRIDPRDFESFCEARKQDALDEARKELRL